MLIKFTFASTMMLILASLSFGQKSVSPDFVLQKAYAKLASLKTIKYKYHQEYNYKSEAYFAESAADSFLEFTSHETNLGVKFQFKNNNVFMVYNGSEFFFLDERSKTIKIESKPKTENLTNKVFLAFSPLMLKNVLPKIIADKKIIKSVSETTTKKQKFYLVEFTLNNLFIQSGSGDISPEKNGGRNIYRLTIDKQNFMPVEVYRGDGSNQDFNKTTFSNIIENATPPIESSWYYSTYLSEFKYAEEPIDNLIKAGEVAHEINLPMFNENRTVSLNEFKGKVVLLYFWIFHCSPCQASVPKLNALQEKYKGQGFRLLTVNTVDSEKQIHLFIKKTKLEFPILHQGEAIAKQYGVWFYPTVVLVGKNGEVLYSGEFEKEKIDNLIKTSL